MKKIFATALVMAVIAGGFTANAQTQAKPKNDKTEQCDKSRKCDGKDKKDKKDSKGKKDGARKHHDKGQRPDLFAGINLTPEQKSQLEALKANRPANTDNKKGEDRQAHRAEFDAKVKQILTPEQWTIYRKNVENMKANRQKKHS